MHNSKTIKFPQDEQSHKCNVEWWYYNGLLFDDKKNPYGYMACLFKVDNKKVKIPYLNKLPFKQLYFFHSIITDVKNQKSYPVSVPISLTSKDSFTKPLLFVNFINYTKSTPLFTGNFTVCQIEEITPFVYRLKTDELDLHLISRKPPLLENKTGFVKLHSKDTYYYSLTDLETKGTININGKDIKVKGKSWFDHQWANTTYTKDIWNWFSIQLDNGTDLVCFEYNNGKVSDFMATIIYKDGRQETYTDGDVILKPLGDEWQSQKTKAKYPISWRVEIQKAKIFLTTKPLVEKQEVVFGAINYWEGPLKVVGEVALQKVSGQGYMELVGRAANISAISTLKEVLNFKIK